ncbi:uncharacterized protein METZ01_LOCUS117408 [marine metagenome]|uniref:Uncharacterized protein n=1 Tax=marine metagenome TaxID=408172 RepID=A0A381XIH0_9ZZZZ|tara:strand:+ start:243 stop:572 length:330 start_codon:yes stop_codon:yes gene_type:complete
MATFFRNKVVKEVGTVPVKCLETDGATRSTIIGINLTNLLEGNVFVSILVHDDTSVQGFYLKDVMIPPNTSLRALSTGEKLILAPSNSLHVVTDTTDSIDVILSYVDIV